MASGKHIEALRKAANVTEQELASAAGIDQSMVAMIERGEKHLTQELSDHLEHAIRRITPRGKRGAYR